MRNKPVAIYAILSVLLLLAACRNQPSLRGPASVSGDTRIDSLLSLADKVDEVGDTDIDFAIPLLEEADSMASQKGYGAVALWAKGTKAFLLSSPEAAAILSQALEQADSSANPYLYARIRFDLSRALPDTIPELARYQMACRSIPQFIAAGDSLRAMQAFFFVNVLYGYVWDRDTQAEVLSRAESFVPDSLPVLRALMGVNILGLARDGDDIRYLELLDKAARDSIMLDAVAPMGAMIGADLYRLRGDTSALLSARKYADETQALAPEHPALPLYNAYMLRYFTDNNRADSAAIYAAVVRRMLDYGSPYDAEMASQLAAYYRFTGDTAAEAAMQLSLRSLEEARNAYDKAREMEQLAPDRLIKSLINPDNQPESGKTHSKWPYIAIAAAVILPAILLLRRRHKRSEAGLRGQLDKANRRLAAQHLRAIDKEQAINLAISSLDLSSVNGIDGNELQAVIVKLKAAAADTGEWERFDAIFTGLRPGFSERLTAAYPTLTKGELRLASLLSMDLDTKHIARLLNIQPDSVKKGRQRLRARFGMAPDLSFTEFLSRF